MRDEAVYVGWWLSTFMRPPMRLGRQIQVPAVARADHEQALPVLRHAVVRGVEHTVGARVAELEDPIQQGLEERCRSVSVCQPEDVLDEVRLRSKGGKEPQIIAEKPSLRIT